MLRQNGKELASRMLRQPEGALEEPVVLAHRQQRYQIENSTERQKQRAPVHAFACFVCLDSIVRSIGQSLAGSGPPAASSPSRNTPPRELGPSGRR
jgi:hypothetical protein